MNKKGFTLIELIAVIMIISIIIGIALPRFGGVQDEAFIAKAKGELRTLQTAMESYYIRQTPNVYPPSAITPISRHFLNASPRILSEALYDPFVPEGEEYVYMSSPNERYYVIFSVGPDTEGDITGIDDNGDLEGEDDDDIFVTNGSGW